MNKAMTYDEFKEKVGSIILTSMEIVRLRRSFKCFRGSGNCKSSMSYAFSRPSRFGELKKILSPITNTMLTNALKELEADELVHREQYNEIPPRVEYALTEKGRDLLPYFTPSRSGD